MSKFLRRSIKTKKAGFSVHRLPEHNTSVLKGYSTFFGNGLILLLPQSLVPLTSIVGTRKTYILRKSMGPETVWLLIFLKKNHKIGRMDLKTVKPNCLTLREL